VQAGPAGVGTALAGLVLLALGLWLLEVLRSSRGRWRRIAQGTAAVSLAAAVWLAIDLTPSISGVSETGSGGTLGREKEQARSAGRSNPASTAFSGERLAAAREAGRPVFVNMTAAWCITCLVNERVALSRPAVVAAFAARDLLYLKGDWTNRDARITDYLAGFGRSGVPLYVYYPPGAEPQVLPQVLTESIVLDALQP